MGYFSGTATGTVGAAVSIGFAANSGVNNIGNNSIAIGNSTISSGDGSIAIGTSVQLTGAGGNIGIGAGANAMGGSGVALGVSAVATTEAIGIGAQATADTASSTVIGHVAGTTTGFHGTRHISIGAYSNIGTTGQPVGSLNEGRAIGDESIAIGAYTRSVGANSVAIGYVLSASGANAIAMGQGNLSNSTQGDNTVDNSFALMFSENLPDYHIVKGKAQTIANTTTPIVSYPIAADSSYTIEATFNARDITGTAGNAHSSWTMQALVYRNNANSAVMEGGNPVNITVIQNTNATSWNATLDVNGNNCRALVTGTNTQTINWSVILQVTRVS